MATERIKLRQAARRNPVCAILTRAATFDNRAKRERTRSNQIRKALKDYGY